MKLTNQQKKEFEKYRAGCDFYHHGWCLTSPCFCRKSFKEELDARKKRIA